MSFLCFVISFSVRVILCGIHMCMLVGVHIRVCIYICIYFGLRDFAILTIVCAIVLALVLMTMLLLVLLAIGSAPQVHGAYAFGHIIAATLPQNVPWCPWRIPIAGTSMSRVDSISG
jgi:hypothetical protein